MRLKEIISEITTNNRTKNNEPLKIDKSLILKLTAGVLSLGVLIGVAQKINNNKYSVNSEDGVNNKESSYSESGEIQKHPILEGLEEVDLQTTIGGKLTSNSVQILTESTIKEIEEIYNACGNSLPPVLEWQRLASLFYVENTCRPIDPNNDSHIGIGQVGIESTKMAIKRANKLYNNLIKSGVNVDADNYIIKNIVCIGSEEEIENFARYLWEQAKTDPKICSTLSALYLADLSGRYYTAYGENVDAVVMMYNAGEGSFKNFIDNGVIEFSNDKKSITVDLTKVDMLSDRMTVVWNEAITYLIRVNGGCVLAKNDPNADLLNLFEMHRLNVGKNDNYMQGSINTNQYDYVPDSVIVRGLEEGNIKTQ